MIQIIYNENAAIVDQADDEAEGDSALTELQKLPQKR